MAAISTSHTHDYTSRFGSVSRLDVSALSAGYIETAPVEATTLDGRKVSFPRKKRLQAYSATSMSKVSGRSSQSAFGAALTHAVDPRICVDLAEGRERVAPTARDEHARTAIQQPLARDR